MRCQPPISPVRTDYTYTPLSPRANRATEFPWLCHAERLMLTAASRRGSRSLTCNDKLNRWPKVLYLVRGLARQKWSTLNAFPVPCNCHDCGHIHVLFSASFHLSVIRDLSICMHPLADNDVVIVPKVPHVRAS